MENHAYVLDGQLVLKLDTEKMSERPDEKSEPDPEEEEKCPEPEIIELDKSAIMYGDLCEDKHNRNLCEEFVMCHKSWPAHDPNQWESISAVCRILPSQKPSNEYTYGELSNNQKAGSCGADCS